MFNLKTYFLNENQNILTFYILRYQYQSCVSLPQTLTDRTRCNWRLVAPNFNS